MKRLFKYALVLAAALAVSTGCSRYAKMAREVDTVGIAATPSPVTLNGSKAETNLTLTIPADYFNKKALVCITPVLKNDKAEVKAKPIYLQGEKINNNYTVVNFKEGGEYIFPVSFDYSPELKMSNLELLFAVEIKDDFVPLNVDEQKLISRSDAKVYLNESDSERVKEIIENGSLTIGKGVNTLQQEIVWGALMVKMKDNYKNVTTVVEKADINYSISSSRVNQARLNDEQLARFKKIVEENKNNPRISQSVFANGYASPDGATSFNESLSKSRSKSGKAYADKMLSNSGMPVDAAAYGEDWAGLAEEIRASDILDKDLILQVMRLYSSSSKREQEMKNMTKLYSDLKKEILPLLRRTQLANKMEIQGRTRQEMLAAVKAKKYADFTLEEALYITNNLPINPAQKVAILEAALKSAPNCYRVMNNLAVAYVMQRNFAKAEQMLNKALEAGAEGEEINRNLLIMNLAKGDIAKAKSYLQIGDEVSAAAIAAAEGNYVPATKSFKQYNLAIAYTQLGNYSAAKQAIANGKCAPCSYLRAVILTREGDKAAATTELKAAVKMNKALADKAKMDANLAPLFEGGLTL